tara:strand:+ start:2327 stop:3250 length:924 start_codon:yes stop_codon:yes gene_type:complete
MVGSVPVRLKASAQQYAQKSQELITRGQDQEDAQAIDRFPVPKVVTGGNFEIVGRHPNKASFIMFGDNADYSTKAELNLVAGAFGAVQTEVDPETGKAAQYQYPSPADAASLVLSEATDDTGLVSLVGKPNFRAAIKAKADTVKIHAREVLELAAGGENYIGNTAQNPSKYGAVHIIAGNRIGDSDSDFSLQPIPKGNNLREFLEQQIEFIQNLTSVQQQTIEEIISLRTTLTAAGTALAGGVGPALLAAVPAAGNLLVAAMATASPKTALVLSNNLGVGVNNTLFKTNYLKEYSPKFILSKFNKVN